MTIRAGFSDLSGLEQITSGEGDSVRVLAVTNWGCSCCASEPTVDDIAKAVWLARLINASGETEPSRDDEINAQNLIAKAESR